MAQTEAEMLSDDFKPIVPIPTKEFPGFNNVSGDNVHWIKSTDYFFTTMQERRRKTEIPSPREKRIESAFNHPCRRRVQERQQIHGRRVGYNGEIYQVEQPQPIPFDKRFAESLVSKH